MASIIHIEEPNAQILSPNRGREHESKVLGRQRLVINYYKKKLGEEW